MTHTKQLRYVLHKLFQLNASDHITHQLHFTDAARSIIAQYGIGFEPHSSLTVWATEVNNDADGSRFERFIRTCREHFDYSHFKI